MPKAPPAVLAGDQASLAVEDVAVGVMARLAEGAEAVLFRPAFQLIGRDVAEDEEAAIARHPHRALGEFHVAGELAHLRGGIDAAREFIRRRGRETCGEGQQAWKYPLHGRTSCAESP
jgi:hypothetical protein